jgi:cellulose synthase/poly-beta-1,6-N-acetylglucosamine synthase-like glycosyltransferase
MEAMEIARGIPSIPKLSGVTPLQDANCPPVSILFAARDEARELPKALETLLALDYPRFEVVAVDDRSADATGEILQAAAQKNAHLKPIRVDSLPSGWLGKPHALEQAYEYSTGEWLAFTDADVHFAQDLLRRAVALAKREKWEHLTLLGRAKMFSFGEKIVMTFFGMGFIAGIRPWRVSDPRSHVYAGVGAFQLIRRSTYEAIGGHRRLAMEVVDDMKLGKLVKEAGFHSGVANAGDTLSVHWHSGVGNIIRGTTKNFFATTGFRLWMTLLQVFGLLLMCLFPVVALPFVHGWARGFDLVAILCPVLTEGCVCLEFGVSPIYALTYPIGALIFGWMLARSAIVTLWQGGIVWRGTFYPLEELKRGVV